MHVRRLWAGAAVTAFLGGCGAGAVTSKDVNGGEAVVIGVVVVMALLFVAWAGGRGR